MKPKTKTKPQSPYDRWLAQQKGTTCKTSTSLSHASSAPSGQHLSSWPAYSPPTGADTLAAQRSAFVAFANMHRLVVNPKADWRCVAPAYGTVNGLPTLHGKRVATNGIMCILERTDGTLILDCHNDWFVPDKADKLFQPRKQSKLDQLMALLED